ncbi:uncharacterized protein C2845_PM14G11260 [Panicum miliaceum]|uniref:Myb/SANT-like domain-containing protein n=1 Tax=Panicum miliaceum TaxID=4540 RepID=A0A3L6PMM9_PANMI|nr:uncharacterized protein C2845_PM14G11260 [Panicum miliaceum]
MENHFTEPEEATFSAPNILGPVWGSFLQLLLLQLARKATSSLKQTCFSHQRASPKAHFCLGSKSSARGASRACALQPYEPPHKTSIKLPAFATGIYSENIPVPTFSRLAPPPPERTATRVAAPRRRPSHLDTAALLPAIPAPVGAPAPPPAVVAAAGGPAPTVASPAGGPASAIAASWILEVASTICKDETLAGNRAGTTLSFIGYKNLEEIFFAITKRHYPHGKLKNKWDALKPQYNLWLDLKRAATGLGFDVVKGTITTSDEWWEEKIAENKKYAAFHEAPMENLDELCFNTSMSQVYLRSFWEFKNYNSN